MAAYAKTEWRRGAGVMGVPNATASCLTKDAIKVTPCEYADCKIDMSSESIDPSIEIGNGRDGDWRLLTPPSLRHGSRIFRLRQKSQGSDSEIYTHYNINGSLGVEYLASSLPTLSTSQISLPPINIVSLYRFVGIHATSYRLAWARCAAPFADRSIVFIIGLCMTPLNTGSVREY